MSSFHIFLKLGTEAHFFSLRGEHGNDKSFWGVNVGRARDSHECVFINLQFLFLPLVISSSQSSSLSHCLVSGFGGNNGDENECDDHTQTTGDKQTVSFSNDRNILGFEIRNLLVHCFIT